MSKTKHNTPRKPKPNKIEFSKLQQGFLIEVRNRQVIEWNAALESVYRDIGIMEKIRQAPPGTYQLRQGDLSGLDVVLQPVIKKKSGS